MYGVDLIYHIDLKTPLSEREFAAFIVALFFVVVFAIVSLNNFAVQLFCAPVGAIAIEMLRFFGYTSFNIVLIYLETTYPSCLMVLSLRNCSLSLALCSFLLFYETATTTSKNESQLCKNLYLSH